MGRPGGVRPATDRRESHDGRAADAAVGAHGAPTWRRPERSRGGDIYAVEMADRIAGELRALAATDRRRLRKQAVVRRLKQPITIVQQRGYTLEEIAEKLTEWGLEITAPTLKSYLQRAKRRSGKRRTRQTRPVVL